jgi:hypothetical protein
MAEDIRKKIVELNERLLVLDRKFNLYLSGLEKLPPIKEFEQLKRDVKGTVKSKNSLISVRMIFFVNSFQQRFNSYRTKWERSLHDIEIGRATRGSAF